MTCGVYFPRKAKIFRDWEGQQAGWFVAAGDLMAGGLYSFLWLHFRQITAFSIISNIFQKCDLTGGHM
jgi:hypothetical protein